ncbi:hypothetical protein AN189_12340 [Loktanella sp. 3ANDIMAR09]|uniref:hypothetical protein n=1 Tax=Loktanella sp. 3ANDIMAR09 TaxID=1225657 RepID=UPI0006FCF3A2|nr:hypothetical protein [Loktanella sp. 3ANDIMAR09]KQI68176.1 hypothetical protein AN189_12340 [Loktanella sp. 3ANDIMAR09]
MKRLIDYAAIMLLVLFIGWLLLPSGLFLRDISMTVDGRTVRYVRETPFGSVTAEWASEITLIDGEEFECSSGGWRVATYQEVQGNTVTYDLGAWADKCLEAGPPYYLTTVRRVLLLGRIPLREMRTITEVQGTRQPIELILVPVEQ